MNRRPLASRQTGWARAAAQGLTRAGVAPNAISAASVGFAAVGALAFWAATVWGGWTLVLAAACCQARLLCNLLDGMVAVEGRRGAPDGPFWNEVPDRLSDILFLTGAGLAIGALPLGIACACGAVLTAYLREAGRAEGFAPAFRGPMAKPHRMAMLTAGALVAVVWPPALPAALWGILVGLVVTVLRRAARLRAALLRRG